MAYRAYELCILLTNSKLLIASPRRAGVKGMVNSLKDRRFSPRSISGMLLTMFSSATLAQALLAVYISMDIYIINKEWFSWRIGNWPGLRTTAHQGKSLPAFHHYLHASGRERSSRRQVYCSWSAIRPIYIGAQWGAASNILEECHHFFIERNDFLDLHTFDPKFT